MGDPVMTSTLPPPRFLFITCQVGAEAAVKEEIARRWPDFRIGYARPGFLTYKLPEGKHLTPDFRLGSVFARAYGFSLGNASLDDPAAAARDAWRLLGDRPISRIHVWERDRWESGELGFTPCVTPRALAAYDALKTACPKAERLAGGNHLTEAAAIGELVADVILVEANQWWVGYHRARSVPSRWPGGIMDLHAPPGTVSRAWLKMEEALAWANLPAGKGAQVRRVGKFARRREPGPAGARLPGHRHRSGGNGGRGSQSSALPSYSTASGAGPAVRVSQSPLADGRYERRACFHARRRGSDRPPPRGQHSRHVADAETA